MNSFSIPYRSGYTPSYEWDPTIAQYRRLYNGKPYVDGATNEQVTCDNVIVQSMEYAWYNGESDRPQVTITFFEPDEQKNGGAYRSVAGCVRRIDECRRVLILTDRTEIPIDRIYRLEESAKP